MTDPFWGKSQCLGSWLHRFTIKRQWMDGVEEVCEICGEQVFFKVVNGKTDNYEYMSYHARQFLMPQHPYFKHEYNN